MALSQPRGMLSPKDWLHFVQLDPFPSAWRRLGLNDEDLRALEILIMAWPEHPPVIRGSGGLRKVRFAPAGWSTGKSGAVRVYYCYFPEQGIITLIYAHAKADMEEISGSQVNAIKGLIEDIQRYLERDSR